VVRSSPSGNFETSEALIVFIHGLGANRHAWWGNSIHALYGSNRIRDIGHVHFFEYHSPKWIAGRPWRAMGIGQKTESIEDVAGRVVTEVRGLLTRRSYSAVVFVGHSLGGLVALNSTLEVAQSSVPLFLGKVRPPVLIASPIGGARLARPLSLLPGNVHHKYLCLRSDQRSGLLSNYAQVAADRQHLLPIILGAGSDSAVRSRERWFDPTNLNVPAQNARVISGGHSDCLQNLEGNRRNLEAIEDAIEDSYKVAPLSIPSTGVVVGQAEWK